jgi:hypothetical protein
MTNRANADLLQILLDQLQILLDQLRQDALIDLVLAKPSLILPKTKDSEPVADIPWSRPVGHDVQTGMVMSALAAFGLGESPVPAALFSPHQLQKTHQPDLLSQRDFGGRRR